MPERTQKLVSKQQCRHNELYDQRSKGAAFEVGDIILISKTAWKVKHKIQDRWKVEEYKIIAQTALGVPASKAQPLIGRKAGILFLIYR